VTHEREVAARAGRTIELRDGLVVRDTGGDGGRHAAA
jgi:predicted ABC-type transport system involved in lysophospholipase L1 biosynthesis ATPase subunit